MIWIGKALWLVMMALFLYVMPRTYLAGGIWLVLCIYTVPMLLDAGFVRDDAQSL